MDTKSTHSVRIYFDESCAWVETWGKSLYGVAFGSPVFEFALLHRTAHNGMAAAAVRFVVLFIDIPTPLFAES